MSKKALFLDRDGTIIADTDYPNDPDRVEFVPGTPDALRQIQKEFELIVISNQSGVGRGLITYGEFQQVHKRFIKLLKEEKIDIAGIYYCVHAPEDECDCRKPSPKMILDAADQHDIDLSASIMIGDKMSDVIAGNRAGCRSVLITSSKRVESDDIKEENADFIASDLNHALKWILTRSS